MEKKPQTGRTGKIVTIVICVALVLAVIWAIVTGVAKLMHYGEAAKIESAITPEDTEQEPAPVPAPEEPEQELPANIYNPDGFYELNDLKYYHGGDYLGIPGIDVSSYQSAIDWEQVKAAGVEFAIVRVGYRGYTAGELKIDKCFYDHIEGAIAAGLDVGVYFFSQALTPEEAAEEAAFLLEYIAPYELQYPVVYDWEEIHVSGKKPRTDDMNMLLLTSCADAFCKTITEAGYEAAVYFNQTYGYNQFHLSSLLDYDFWLAEYDETPSFVHNFQMWQYSNEGELPGIREPVDLNVAFVRKDEYKPKV